MNKKSQVLIRNIFISLVIISVFALAFYPSSANSEGVTSHNIILGQLPTVSLTSSLKAGYDYQTTNTPDYIAYFKNNSKSSNAVVIFSQGYTISQDISTSQLHWYNSSLNAIIGMTNEMNPQDNNLSFSGNNVNYKNAWINTNLSYTLERNGIKENLIISNISKRSSAIYADYLQYVSNIAYNATLKICHDGICNNSNSGSAFVIKTNGSVIFKDVNNLSIFTLPVPYISDSSGNKTLGIYSVSVNPAVTTAIAVVNIRIPSTFVWNYTSDTFKKSTYYFDPTVITLDSSPYALANDHINNNFHAGSIIKWDITNLTGTTVTDALMCFYVTALNNYRAPPGCHEFVYGCTQACGNEFLGATSGWTHDMTGCQDGFGSFTHTVGSNMGSCTDFSSNMCAGVWIGGDAYECPDYAGNGNITVTAANCICHDFGGGCGSPPDYNATFNFSAPFFTAPLPLAIEQASVYRINNQTWDDTNPSGFPELTTFALTTPTNVTMPEVNIIYSWAALNKYSCINVTAQVQDCMTAGDQNCSFWWDPQNLPVGNPATKQGNGFSNPAGELGISGWHSPTADTFFTYNTRLAGSNTPYLNVTYTGGGVTDTTAPTNTFISQTPSDINTINLYTQGFNVTYNITDDTGVNASTVIFYYKTNNTISDVTRYINGTAYTGYFQTTGTNQSINWTFSLDDNDIYPGKYNLDQETIESTPHGLLSINANDAVKMEFLNISNSTQYNILEFMANSTVSAGSLFVFYCNSSYSSGNIVTDTNCFQFGSIAGTPSFNVTNPMLNNSKYQDIAMTINLTSGMVGTVKITPLSYFILRKGSSGSWNVYNVSTTSRTTETQTTTNNGGAWTSRNYTFDAHFHQYNGNDTFYYYKCDNDTVSPANAGCSSIRSDILDLAGMPPSAPHVYSPTNGFYFGNININYTQSISPNSYPIVYYNISLANLDESFNKSIIENNSLNLGYVWNSTGTPDGTYLIKVIAYDNQSQSAFDFSENFTLSTPQIGLTLITPPNLNNLNVTQNQFFNVTLNVSCISSGSDCGNINVSLDPSITDVVDPNGDSSPLQWTSTSGSPHYTALAQGVREPNTPSLSTPEEANSASITDVFDMSTLTGVGTVSSVTIWVYGHRGGPGGGPHGECNLYIGGAWQGDQYCITGNDNWYSATYNGAWTQSDLDGMQVNFTRLTGGGEVYIYAFYANVTYTSGGGSTGKGLINTTIGATPFYTNATNNPWTINLNASQSQIVTFYVNATGAVGTNYTFFAAANITSDMAISNQTGNWNVTIVSGADKTSPTFLPNSPYNMNVIYKDNIVQQINATDETALSGFVINDTHFIINNSGYFQNVSNPGVGLYWINVTINDTSNNINSAIFYVNVSTRDLIFTTSVTSPIIYGTPSDYVGSVVGGEPSCTPELFRNGVSLGFGWNPTDTEVLGVGSYVYNFSVTNCVNYTNSEDIKNLVVNQATPSFTYYLNSQNTNNITAQAPFALNASAYTDAGIIFISVNGTDITSSNGLNVTYGQGYYEFIYNVTGNQNYTDILNKYLYANITAAACIQNLQNTTASPWMNLTCVSGQMNQTRNFTQYDANNCGFVNQTIIEYQLVANSFCATNLGIDLLYPLNLNRLNVTQNRFFNVTVNVSCSGGNCGNMNVTLNPKIYTPFIWIANQGSNNVSKINTTSNVVAATIAVGSGPYAIAVDNAGFVWVANINDNNVSKINTATNTVVATIAVGNSPDSITIAPDGSIWVSNFGDANVSVINGTSNSIISTIAVGNGPASSAYDNGFLWVANYNANTVSKINTTSKLVTNTITVGSRPVDVAVDSNGFVWVSNEGTSAVADSNLSKIDPSTNTVVAIVTVGSYPEGVAADGEGYIWTSSFYRNVVYKIDATTNAVVANITVGNKPHGIAVDGNGYIWAVNSGGSIDSINDNVSKIDPSTNTVVATVGVGDFPYSIGDTTGFALRRFALTGSNRAITGVISAAIGTTPFYTNQSNPRTISLNNGQSQVVTFWVNATGAVNTEYIFDVLASENSEPSVSNLTGSWLVHINEFVDTIPPIGYLISPPNGTSSNNFTQNFTFNVTDETALKNATLYIWNTSASDSRFSPYGYITNETDITGTFNQTSLWQSFLNIGTYLWNVFFSDSSGNTAWATNGNFSLTITCTQNLQDTTPSAWINGSCVGTLGYRNQSRNYTRYDANNCGTFTNLTIIESQSILDPTCDSTIPVFTNCRNFTHDVNTSFSELIVATDLSGIDGYFLNDTSIFNVTRASGIIFNDTTLSNIALYNLNLTANDTAGNVAVCLFWINVTAPAPSGPGSPGGSPGGNYINTVYAGTYENMTHPQTNLTEPVQPVQPHSPFIEFFTNAIDYLAFKINPTNQAMGQFTVWLIIILILLYFIFRKKINNFTIYGR